MEIVRETSTTLEIQERPGSYTLVKTGLLLMLVTVLMGLFLPVLLTKLLEVRARSLNCDRANFPQVNCRLTTSRLTEQWNREILSVEGVDVSVRPTGNPTGYETHSLILLTREGRAPTGIRSTISTRSGGSRRSNIHVLGDRVDEFLSSPLVPTLAINHKSTGASPIFSMLDLFAILLAGGIVALVVKTSLPKSVVLDRRSNHFCVTYENALSLSSQVQGRLSDIERARLYVSVQLVLKSGRKISISASDSSSGLSKADLIEKINQFLGKGAVT